MTATSVRSWYGVRQYSLLQPTLPALRLPPLPRCLQPHLTFGVASDGRYSILPLKHVSHDVRGSRGGRIVTILFWHIVCDMPI